MKNIIILWLLIFTINFTKAQQQLPQLNSYMFNQFLYNPASGGMYDSDFNFSTVSRFQWSGVEGAPITSYAWADYRFHKNAMSVGGTLAYDKYGPRQYTDFSANYTYIVRLNNRLKMSFGLRAGIASFQYNVTDLKRIWDANDPFVVGIDGQTLIPKFGTGIQFYTKKYYIGIGLPDLVPINNSQYASDKGKNFFQKNRNYTLLAGYRIKLTDGFSLFPNSKVYYYPNNDVRVDGNFMFEITDYFWGGFSLATTSNASLSAGTYISSRIRFMYAYDFLLSNSGGQALNSHEVNLMIQLDEIFVKKNKVIKN
jgi:type IX secretion system PorP/SprF family membrane protein